MAQRFVSSGPESPLQGVTSAGWRRLVTALEVQHVGTISLSGGLGVFDMRPRRLIELGYATNLRRVDDGAKQICDFILPWTEARFLADLLVQHTVLAKSMRAYYDALRRGELVKPADATMSGTLAVLHIGGHGALKAWPKLFENTQALYAAAQGAF